jgi:hypothetical protein
MHLTDDTVFIMVRLDPVPAESPTYRNVKVFLISGFDEERAQAFANTAELIAATLMPYINHGSLDETEASEFTGKTMQYYSFDGGTE